jgi:hypothetical protein
MSTKLHNGYRIKRMGLLQLQEFLTNFGKRAWDVIEGLMAERMARICSSIADDVQLNGVLPEKFGDFDVRPRRSLIGFSMNVIRDNMLNITKTGLRNPAYDFNCEICVMPIRGKILATLYTEQKELREFWEAQSEVSEYAYWNHSDRPDHLTDAQWRRRDANWEKALRPGGWVPGRVGLAFSCLGQYSFPHPNSKHVIPRIRSVWQRARYLARELFMHERIEAGAKKAKKKGEKPDYGSLIVETEKWARTRAGRSAVVARARIIRTSLKRIRRRHLCVQMRELVGEWGSGKK